MPRTVPAAFQGVYIPILPTVVTRPGIVSYSDSLFNVYYQTNFSGATSYAYVAKTGSETTGKLNSSSAPFLTIQQALRKTTAQRIYVQPGTYDPSDFVRTDVGGATPKMVFCAVRNTCTIAVTGGVDISTSTWTASDYPGVYQTAITSDGVTTGHIQRILLTDSSDYDGFPSRLPLYSSVQSLAQAGNGWFYDSSAKILYLARTGVDISANHANLKALYLNKSGLARQLISGTTVLFEGFYMNGVSFDDIEFVQGTTYTPSALWVTDSKIAFANDYGIWVIGSHAYVESTWIHANHVDGMNGNWSRGGVNDNVMFAANTVSTAAGDYDTFGATLSPYNNGFSSHEGYFICFACTAGNYDDGPDFADSSSTANVPSKTWLVGTVALRKLAADTADFGGYQWTGCPTCAAGDPRHREVWIDTASSGQEGGDDLVANYNAFVHMFNVTTSSGLKGYHMATPVTYIPVVP